MALSTSQLSKSSSFPFSKSHFQTNQFLILPSSISIPNPRTSSLLLPICLATRSQTGPVNKHSSSQSSSSAGNTSKKKKKKTKSSTSNLRDVEILKDGDVHVDDFSDSNSSSSSLSYHPTTPLPNPPAGFVVDGTGRVLMASQKRLATIVSDEEVESILPAAAYALAKIHMHLVHSGFCYTARGGFCYSEDDIFDFRTDDGQDIEGLPTEGVEITCFHLDGAHYMIYTPSDPLLFVVVKDQNGQLQIADDDLLEDPAIISAIDEETEFNALVEEEAALLESLMSES
ncbi:uncharacterized protein [Euphorbia lathyris]|uniref:uncharacterized protein isoform X2 n=1 Tax=Euphorbia lathyris TaxID=212925 RepID=UPI003313371C